MKIHGLGNISIHSGVVLFCGQSGSWATSPLEQASVWAARYQDRETIFVSDYFRICYLLLFKVMDERLNNCSGLM